MATTVEIVLAGSGQMRSIYLDYFHGNEAINQHIHAPLEEALANAYAYNSFTFISRVTFGYKKTSIDLFQKAM